jgi:hypothetical protein
MEHLWSRAVATGGTGRKCVAAENGLLIEVVNLGLRRSSEPEEPVLPVAGRIGPPLIR